MVNNKPSELGTNRPVSWRLMRVVYERSIVPDREDPKKMSYVDVKTTRYYIEWESINNSSWQIEITKERYWELEEDYFPIVGG